MDGSDKVEDMCDRCLKEQEGKEDDRVEVAFLRLLVINAKHISYINRLVKIVACRLWLVSALQGIMLGYMIWEKFS